MRLFKSIIKQFDETPKYRYVVLRGIEKGNVFWTTDDGSDHESEGFEVLHRGNDEEEMIKKCDFYRGFSLKF